MFFCRFEKQEGVVLMATTRNLKQIDEALQRPGRMDRIFHLQQPTQTEREKILLTAAKETMDVEIIDYVDWSKVIVANLVFNFKYTFDSFQLLQAYNLRLSKHAFRLRRKPLFYVLQNSSSFLWHWRVVPIEVNFWTQMN